MTTFGSVCSGIEAASVAWNPLGWEAAWFAEIEPFPCRLLAHHYPTVPNLGDMTTIADKILAGTIPAPDILCGGTPCQAFSVAGLRNSMGDSRGQLSLEFVRIADAIDTVRPGRPCAVFWENVPGVLSTKDNAFGCFLGALAGEDEPLSPPGGRWTHAGCVSGPTRTVAWRILDAQYFGLAQRRKRVFVVASAGGINPIQVLFESEGVRRDTAPSRKAGKGFAATFEVGPGGGRESGVNPTLDCRCKNGAMQNQVASAIVAPFQPIADCLTAAYGTKWNGNASADNGSLFASVIACRESGPGYWMDDDLSTTLRAEGENRPSRPSQVVAFHPTQDPISSVCHIIGGIDNENNAFGPNDPTGPLMKDSPTGGGRPLPAVAFRATGRSGYHPDDKAECLRSCGAKQGDTDLVVTPSDVAICADLSPTVYEMHGQDSRVKDLGDVCSTVTSKWGTGGGNVPVTMQPFDVANCLTQRMHKGINTTVDEGQTPVLQGMQVRRLTPTECEKLMGFPPGYTAIPKAADGPRYKALGNSWAVPVVAWIGQRIKEQLT